MTIIERLRRLSNDGGTGYGMPIAGEAADLLESQAARIAELEAEVAEERLCRKEADVAINQYMTLYRALRRKIDEAPVVAWQYQWDTGNGIWTHKLQGAELFDFIPDPHTVHPLISKEDLA